MPESERLKPTSVLADCPERPELDALTGRVGTFGRLSLRSRGDQLRLWSNVVRADDLPSLHAFVNGLERDLAAVPPA